MENNKESKSPATSREKMQEEKANGEKVKKEITAEEILDALNDHYMESIFVTDGEGKVIYVNTVGAKRIGPARDKLLGRNVMDLVDEGVYDKSTTMTAIHTKDEAISALTYRAKDSSISRSVPVFDEDGNVKMVVTTNMSKEHNKEWEEIIKKERDEMTRMQRELDHLRLKGHSRIIADSPAMQNVMQTIHAIAPTDSNVVILGESGTGKDVMARYIHENSLRSDKAYISINCAAIPDQLLESELFGYEAGAFTGALSKGKIGLFEAASGGTIFLDEIGDMPLSLQTKLLRAIENREIRRVGGVVNIPVDVRIICATNVDLKQMVAEKTFREDLFYRLSVFVVQLPPLRDRKEDILPLAESFLAELNEKYDEQKVLAPITIETMLSHRWPGNIRELRNVMERIFVVSRDEQLIFTPTPMADSGEGTLSDDGQVIFKDMGNLRNFTATAERWYIEKVLEECDGKVGDAASKLGIHRSVLYRKMHKEQAKEKAEEKKK